MPTVCRPPGAVSIRDPKGGAMFANELRRVAETAARVELPAVSAALWKAFAAGSVTETEAEELSSLIEARKAVPVVTKAIPARRGSKPRTDESLQRRRRWAASGRLPPTLASRFTQAEVAVLAVVAAEVAQHGRCTLAQGHLAAFAGVSVSTVKRALRAAQDCGMLEISVRRISAFRNDTNVIAVVSPEWLSWSRLARQGGGGQRGASTHTQVLDIASRDPRRPKKGSARRQGRIHRHRTLGEEASGGNHETHVLRA